MHPLSCITLESARRGIGDLSSETTMAPARLERTTSVPVTNTARLLGSHGEAVAGALYKWTNFRNGWRRRWFLLDTRDGSLSYSKARPYPFFRSDVRLIGDHASDASGLREIAGLSPSRRNTAAVVHMKISSFRESKSDERRFYIFTARKTLHLKTVSQRDRVAWLQALLSTKVQLPSRFIPNKITISTDRLKRYLIEEGIDEDIVSECEEIVLSELREAQEKFELLCNERSSLLDTIRLLESANTEEDIPTALFSEYQLTKNELSSLINDSSTTLSSEEIEKQDREEVSDGEDESFHDTAEYFEEDPIVCESLNGNKWRTTNHLHEKMHSGSNAQLHNIEASQVERRKRLPDPVEREHSVSLWSLIKDNVGKDLTKVCLPVYFNEPISLLQKCFEDLEYSYLLDKAYECGRTGNSLLRILHVAAFAVSGYASSKGRYCKPFNPLLGETYEAEYHEKGVRFLAEKVSHHPTIMACHSEGRGWKFWADSNLCSKFWGQSIQLNPVGVLTLEFDDGEIFQWSKVTSTIYNIVLGKLYCDHHGVMHIRGNRQYSSRIKFKDHSILERNPHQVHGYVEDAAGKRVATIFGKWDESVHYLDGEVSNKARNLIHSSNANLLWRSTTPPANLTRYNLTSFAITLNELTAGLKEKLPPTDSRLRPDQRHLENGEYTKANAEKQRLEKRQRMSRKLQENGWKPRWFFRENEGETFRYVGGYWEAREGREWDGCPNIFGEFGELREDGR